MASLNPYVIICLALAAQLFIPIIVIWVKSRKIDPDFPVSAEIINFRYLMYCFYAFIVLFALDTFLVFIKAIPTRCTYEAVFGPVIVSGLFWFGVLLWKAETKKKRVKYIIAFLIMFGLANVVDFTLIKLGAWTFSDLTNLWNWNFTWCLGKTMLGKEMTVPIVEIFGFNGTIAWFIFFCGVFLNRLIDKK